MQSREYRTLPEQSKATTRHGAEFRPRICTRGVMRLQVGKGEAHRGMNPVGFGVCRERTAGDNVCGGLSIIRTVLSCTVRLIPAHSHFTDSSEDCNPSPRFFMEIINMLSKLPAEAQATGANEAKKAEIRFQQASRCHPFGNRRTPPMYIPDRAASYRYRKSPAADHGAARGTLGTSSLHPPVNSANSFIWPQFISACACAAPLRSSKIASRSRSGRSMPTL